MDKYIRSAHGGRRSGSGDTMSWIVNEDGTYTVTATRRWLGGKTDTYTYITDKLPMTKGGAVSKGANLEARQTPEGRASIAAGKFFLVVFLIVAALLYAGVHHP